MNTERERNIIMTLVGDVAGLRADLQHVMRTLEDIKSTCRSHCEAGKPQEQPLTARLLVAVSAVASAASAIIVALISIIPQTIQVFSDWLKQKP